MLVASLRRFRRRRGQFSLGGLKSGCCCGSSKICLSACGVALVGATITVSGLGSCTTDATGCCDAPWLTTGSHSYTVTDSSGGTLCSNTQNFTAGATNNVSCVGLTTGRCCHGFFIPATLTATDAAGTFTLTFTGTDISGNPQWQGGYAITLSSRTVSVVGGVCTVAGSSTLGPVRVCYTLTCTLSSTPIFSLLRHWSWVSTGTAPTINYFYYQNPATLSPGVCVTSPPSSCGVAADDTASGTTSTASNSPFSVTFGALAASGGNKMADPVGGGATISQ